MEDNLQITDNVEVSAEESALDEEGSGQPGSERRLTKFLKPR